MNNHLKSDVATGEYEAAETGQRSVNEPPAEYRAIQDYTDLRVWQLAMDLAIAI